MELSSLLYHMERRTGSIISVDTSHPAFYSPGILDLAPEQRVHRGAFCEFAKRYSHGMAKSCHMNKKCSRTVARRGDAFCGTCPYGIWELTQPVMVRGEHVATLYAGYFGTDALQKAIGAGSYAGAPPPAVPQDTQVLKDAGAFIAEFIRVEVELWLASGKVMSKQKPGTFYRDFCAGYIDGNYRENIQLTDVAEALKMSPNYVSARIRREWGRTFSQLLTAKRLAVACTYLEFEPGTSVTDIAFMVGYRDSNYFSTVFRKHFGVSPRAYRNGERAGS